ncbi:unnamed protein product [Cylicocyclus nassatus]|uniref:Uncharacterized protein n=1 Tax=Cylicocyclus nassatus TaxID=53992 RepID=A0AA36GQB0_CYLNA|nr:unnamed protein product [Cylicocyclus nassatus]
MQYTLALQRHFQMFSVILTLAALVLYSSTQTQNYDMECLWCENVIYNARNFFGDNIVNTTNLQFEEYFDRSCRLDARKSALYGAICYDIREFHEERTEQRPASPPLPSTLHDCISAGVLHVDTAAKLILSKMRREEFNEAAYYEFVQSDVAARATTTYGSLNRPLGRDLDLLWGIANRIIAEIARAMATKSIRCFDTAERPLPVVATTPSVTNCTRMWRIDAEPPFSKVNLLKELDDWSPRKKDNAYVQVSALYRHILQRICNPPERIREYSLRINTLKGRDLKLKSLPRGVTDILIEMVEDMLGYGHEELEQFRQTDLQESPWYQNLGSTEQERKQNLADLKEEKKNWRPQLFKSLQLALRDVRSYSYEAGRWIANPRKRGAPGEVDENTVPCSQ